MSVSAIELQPSFLFGQSEQVRSRRPAVDLLAPSVWSDRVRLLTRPDVAAVELILLVGAAALLRQPITEALESATARLGTTAVPAVPAEPIRMPAPLVPLALAPVAAPPVARHSPRDPFAALVPAASPAEGAPAALTAVPGTVAVAPDVTAPVAALPVTPTLPTDPAPAVATATVAATVTVRPGDSLSSIATANGTTWSVLYELNRDAVGSDPDVVRPGVELALP